LRKEVERAKIGEMIFAARGSPHKQNVRLALSAIHVGREVETSCFQ
jgi:hypothetical protein